jgi:hypothetical protein
MKSRGSLRIIETLGFPPNFHKLLGQFHCMWLMFDVQVDWSIGKFLNLPTEQTHILVHIWDAHLSAYSPPQAGEGADRVRRSR